MTRCLLAALLLCACGSPEYTRPAPTTSHVVESTWPIIWQELERRWPVPSEPCYYATDNMDVGDYPAMRVAGACAGKRGCTRSTFLRDVPEGAYTISISDNLSRMVWCRTLLHELMHMATECLEFRWHPPPWSFQEEHPPELFSVPDNVDVYPVELEVRAKAMDGCLYE